jgi:hypothetical protein
LRILIDGAEVANAATPQKLTVPFQ